MAINLKLDTLRHNMQEIGRLTYRIDNFSYSLNSYRQQLEVKKTASLQQKEKLQSLYNDLRSTEQLDKLPGLYENFDEAVILTEKSFEVDFCSIEDQSALIDVCNNKISEVIEILSNLCSQICSLSFAKENKCYLTTCAYWNEIEKILSSVGSKANKPGKIFDTMAANFACKQKQTSIRSHILSNRSSDTEDEEDGANDNNNSLNYSRKSSYNTRSGKRNDEDEEFLPDSDSKQRKKKRIDSSACIKDNMFFNTQIEIDNSNLNSKKTYGGKNNKSKNKIDNSSQLASDNDDISFIGDNNIFNDFQQQYHNDSLDKRLSMKTSNNENKLHKKQQQHRNCEVVDGDDDDNGIFKNIDNNVDSDCEKDFEDDATVHRNTSRGSFQYATKATYRKIDINNNNDDDDGNYYDSISSSSSTANYSNKIYLHATTHVNESMYRQQELQPQFDDNDNNNNEDEVEIVDGGTEVEQLSARQLSSANLISMNTDNSGRDRRIMTITSTTTTDSDNVDTVSARINRKLDTIIPSTAVNKPVNNNAIVHYEDTEYEDAKCNQYKVNLYYKKNKHDENEISSSNDEETKYSDSANCSNSRTDTDIDEDNEVKSDGDYRDCQNHYQATESQQQGRDCCHILATTLVDNMSSSSKNHQHISTGTQNSTEEEVNNDDIITHNIETRTDDDTLSTDNNVANYCEQGSTTIVLTNALAATAAEKEAATSSATTTITYDNIKKISLLPPPHSSNVSEFIISDDDDSSSSVDIIASRRFLRVTTSNRSSNNNNNDKLDGDIIVGKSITSNNNENNSCSSDSNSIKSTKLHEIANRGGFKAAEAERVNTEMMSLHATELMTTAAAEAENNASRPRRNKNIRDVEIRAACLPDKESNEDDQLKQHLLLKELRRVGDDNHNDDENTRTRSQAMPAYHLPRTPTSKNNNNNNNHITVKSSRVLRSTENNNNNRSNKINTDTIVDLT